MENQEGRGISWCIDWIDALFTPLVIVTVAFASFGLGRLSVRWDNAALNTAAHTVSVGTFTTTTAEFEVSNDVHRNGDTVIPGGVVGSSRGNKYHYPWCPGAERIKEANKIYFASVEEARRAGYQPARNCKGLP